MRFKALRTITLSSVIVLMTLSIAAMAAERGHGFAGAHGFGGNRAVVVNSYPYWGWGGWGDPFWGGYYGPYYYDNRGKVKIKNANKYDQVYVNGAYAGTVQKMKNIRLDPGRYNIKVRHEGKDMVNREVHIVTGKTVDINVGSESSD